MKFKISIAALLAVITTNVGAQSPPEKSVYNKVVTEVGGPVSPHITDIDLSIMPRVRNWQPGDSIKEVPKRWFGAKNKAAPDLSAIGADKLVEIQAQYGTRTQRAFNSPVINQAGQGFNGVNPPDPTLDVGRNHVIQAINDGSGSKFQIFDKTSGTSVAGPLTMSTLGTGQCATGLGDPIVLYDESVNRWFMQEFSNQGNFMCIYISKTDNPVTGGWYHYGFSDTEFPDYPHFGVWPNAYIGGSNNSTRPVYAFDRENMLAGATARPMQKFTITGLDGFGFQLATPADWDLMPGTSAPPANAPAILLRHVDEEAHSNNNGSDRPDKDYLEMFEFTVDWNTPANSGLNNLSIDLTDFNSCLINFQDFDTVPQPNSTGKLDAIREVIYNRLQYVNFGSHESIIGVLPTNITAGCTPVQAGLRWFELRRTNGTSGSWALHQEGTYANNSNATQNRLLASISMDASGNIAMAYNMTDTDSSNPVSAGIRYTGRIANDPLGIMSQTEAQLVAGSGANTSGRWGDYASMGVDPVDGCTFWFTGPFQDGVNWNTQISAVKFDQCGSAGFTLSSPNNTIEVCNMNGSSNGTFNINVGSIGGHTGSVNLAYNPSLPSGISGSFSSNPVSIGNSSDANLIVGSNVNSGQYNIGVLGSSSGVDDRSLPLSINVVDEIPAVVTLQNPADQASGVSASNIVFDWQAISGVTAYQIQVAADPQFNNIIVDQIVGTNSHTANLAAGTTYFWRVRAKNLCGDGVFSPTATFNTNADLCFAIGSAIPFDETGLNAEGNVTTQGTLSNLQVSVKASHSWVGDLIMNLSHNGTSITLMEQPGEGNCEEDNIDATFVDGTSNPVANVCQTNSPAAISGDVNPNEALSAFNGSDINGIWTLNVIDTFEDDDGTLTEFCLLPTFTQNECQIPPNNDPDVIFKFGFECD